VVREVENALERARLTGQVTALERRLGTEAALVGASAPMRQLADTIARVAKIPSPVLITGESGSGKELVAHELHRLGANPAGPFVALNAGALPATTRDVEAEIAAGKFHQDLYDRLNLHLVPVPPLRERRSDLPALVDHLLGSTCARFGMRPKRLDPAALECLMTYEWRRNNVRELRNAVERMVIAADGDMIRLDDVPAEVREAAAPGEGPPGPAPTSFQARKAEAERQIIVAAL